VFSLPEKANFKKIKSGNPTFSSVPKMNGRKFKRKKQEQHKTIFTGTDYP